MVESRTGTVELLDAAAREPSRRFDAPSFCVALAHPDDETIGCGSLLWSLRGALVVVVTDGAPRSLRDARACGYSTAEAYAAARACEWCSALTIAEVPTERQVMLGIPDQQTALDLGGLTRSLAGLFEAHDIEIALTHSYEGGHPDHDAVAFACHAAARALRAKGKPFTILELPLYRAECGRFHRQSFVRIGNQPGPDWELSIAVTGEPLERKIAMRDAYASQAATLAPFRLDIEHYRLAPDYDFATLPNGGDLLYERFDWGLDGFRWLELVSRAITAAPGHRPC